MMHVFIIQAVLLLSVLNAVAQEDSPSAQDASLYNQGFGALQAKDYPKAKELLMQALKGGEDSAYVWYALGVAANAMKDFDLMVRAGRRLLVLSPERGEGLHILVGAYHALNRYDSLVIVARQFLDQHPDMATKARIPEVLKSLSADAIGSTDSVFSTPDGNVKISLPASWSTKHTDDGKSLNWFISLQPVVKESDLFATGVTVRWFRRLSKTFPDLEGNTDVPFMLGFWRTFMADKKAKNIFYEKDVAKREVTIGGWAGELVTQDLQVNESVHRLRKYDVMLVRGDEIFTVMLECPIEQWPLYESRFKAALASIQVPN